MSLELQATNVNPFALPGPGQASFVFDALGFGPKTFTLRVDDGLIGLDIPRVSAGFDLTLGARLILEAGFDAGQLDIAYPPTLAFGAGMALTDFERFVITTGEGDDRIDLARNRPLGPRQDDSISAGDGDDVLAGGAGNDSMDGGAGTDTATYQTSTGPVVIALADGDAPTLGQDGVFSGATFGSPWGTDTLWNIENLTGGRGDDVLTGNAGANRLSGLDGDDMLTGGDGRDVLLGGRGDDVLVLGPGRDRAAGGLGADLFVITGADGRDTVADFALGLEGEALDLRPLLDLFDAADEDPFRTGLLELRDAEDGAETLAAAGVAGRRAVPIVVVLGVSAADLADSGQILIA